jgi:hypothetical protein
MLEYNSQFGYRAWLRYLRGRVSKREVFAVLEKYVSSKAERRTVVRGIAGSLQAEEAVQQARIRLWDAVQRKRIPSRTPKEMHSYLISMIHTEVDAYPMSERKEFPPEVMYGLARRSNPSLETEMTLGELPEVLRNRVGASILGRFPEISPGAAKYVLDRVLNGERLSESWLRRQYNVQEPRFFLESVMVAVRMTLYQLREDIYPLSKTLSGTLYGSFVEEQW